MKPAYERNQECLPPKKRELAVNSGGGGTAEGLVAGSAGKGLCVGVAEEAPSTHSSDSAGCEAQGGGATRDWMRVQPGLHYGVENTDGMGVPVDQYGMLYKVAATYSPTSLHPVLSHISPAYTVPSQILQHPGISYSPLAYAQIPHSSFQFVGSPYAVPYALPPGFVPGHLMSPQSTIQQPHHVPHLVGYPSVIQEGVVSPPPPPPPQSPASMHTFAKVAPAGGISLVLPPAQQQQQQHLGVAEVSPRGASVFYHHPGSRSAGPYRDPHVGQQERKRELNGGEAGRGGREPPQDLTHPSRGVRLPPVADRPRDRAHAPRGPGERGSPGHGSTLETDLEVQEAVGCLSSPSHGMSGVRKEASFGPLNLSQSSSRTASAAPPAGTGETRKPPHYLQQVANQAVVLANGQQVLVPLDHPPQWQYLGLPDGVAPRGCLPERAPEPQTSQPSPTPLPAPARVLVPPAGAPHPSHFMKGAIIQLATGELKRVEDLQTQDFVRSAEASGGLKIDSSMVVDLRKSQQKPGLVSLHFTVGEQQSKVTIDVPPEHPFFVFGQGWSSCSPDRTAQLYGLACHPLQVGDVCVSIALHQKQSQQQPQTQTHTLSKARLSAGVQSQAMGPPVTHPPRPQAQLRVDRTHWEEEEEEEEDEQEEPMEVQNQPPRSDRAPADQVKSQSGYYLHTEGQPLRPGAGGASQRRWSSPSFQRYGVKGGEEARPSASPTAVPRPSFIPQEVKLSIEGRSNAGK